MPVFKTILGLSCLFLTVQPAIADGNAASKEVPWEPAARTDPPAWPEMVKEQAAAVHQAHAKVIFIGDSLTEGWDEELWQARIAPSRALNLGLGGDGPQHVLWRIEHGILDGPSPEAVVLMIGINNFWRDFTAADTARGIETILERIHARHPASRIILLGLLPVYEAQSPIRPWIGEINARLKQRHGQQQVEFVDLSAGFLETDGNLRRMLYAADNLHLSKAGYVVLTRGLTPILHLPASAIRSTP